MKKLPVLATLAGFTCLMQLYVGIGHAQMGVSYLNDPGSPAYSTLIPVENGYINVSNGNLHLEFPLAHIPQRGALDLTETLEYDSRIWMFAPFGSHAHWWPYNVAGSSTSSGGWRLVTSAETGTLAYNGNNNYTWTDPTGITHIFDPTTAWATDGSGYSFVPYGPFYGIIIRDRTGAAVWPQVTDRYNNFLSVNSNGDVVDDTNRVPVITTVSGNTTYYDVVAPNGTINNNGTRIRYAVTTAPVAVSTNFNVGGIYEWVSPNDLNPVQTIQMPDGSQYTFGYDDHGELATMTLPTGGVIRYGYSNWSDSSYTTNRWLTSRTVGNNSPMTFTPSVVSYCVDYSGNCVENVLLHKPSGDETTYELTLNNGAWNTAISTYTHTAAGGTLLAKTSNAFNFANTCFRGICPNGGAEYISKTLETTHLPTLGGGINKYTQLTYSNVYAAQLGAVKEWDYINQSAAPPAGSPPSTAPTRETDYAYTGFDVQSVTVKDSSGNPSGQTTYGYSTTAARATSGLPQRGTLLTGGPYLNTITHWLNTAPTSSPVTTISMDDSGQVFNVLDADGGAPYNHPASTIQYQCANSLPQYVYNPNLTTYSYDCNSGALQGVQGPNDAAATPVRAGTTYNFDTDGRLLSVTTPDAGVTSYTYPSAAEVDTTVTATPDPAITTVAILDTYGRPYQMVQNGIATETTYDANGRVQAISTPYVYPGTPASWAYNVSAYDGLDRPVQFGTATCTQSWIYNGNSVSPSSLGGCDSTSRTADAFGHLTTVNEPGPAGSLTTNLGYDGLGNLVKISQLGNQSGDVSRVRTFTYDSLARMICSSKPEISSALCPTTATTSYTSGTIGYTYDPNGNLVTKIAPTPSSSAGSGATITTSFSYDNLNRIVTKSYTGDLEWTPWSCYQYDTAANGIGRLGAAWTQYGGCSPTWAAASSSAWAATTILSYDPVGKVSNQQECVSANCTTGGTPFTVGYGYDLAGNRTATNLSPLGGLIQLNITTPTTNGYNASGQLQQLLSNLVDTTHPAALFSADPSLGYAPQGALQKATFGTGLLLNRNYDAAGRILSEIDKNP